MPRTTTNYLVKRKRPEQKREEKEFYKQVSKIALSDILPKMSFPPGFDYAIVSSNEILNFCSAKYELVENYKIYIPLEFELKKANLPYRKIAKIINGSRFYVDYIIGNRLSGPTVNDIQAKISVWNSYDGSLRFRQEMGFYRVTSGSILSRPTESKVKTYKHSRMIQDNNVFTQIVLDIQDFIKQIPQDLEVFEKMNRRKAGLPTLIETGKRLKLSHLLIDAARERFIKETTGGESYINEFGELVKHPASPKTILTIYNALNWAIYNRNPKELPEKKLERDRKLLELLS
jgi:hypothetical protein